MARIFFNFTLFLLLILPSTFLLTGNGGSTSGFAWADDDDEDLVEGEEDDAQIDAEEEVSGGDTENVVVGKEGKPDEEEDEGKPLVASPDADTHILFTQPSSLDLPAGAMVKFLVGFTNKGEKDFFVETLFASFRYPMDFSFFIQNFSTVYYNKQVEPKKQATFDYAFIPSETFNARPFGLAILLDYKDSDGNLFQDAVFNDTINIIEPDEGLDGETFFLYVFLAACAVLLLVVGQQFLASFSRKRPAKKQVVEMGTQNVNDVDYDWIPEGTLQEFRKNKQIPNMEKDKPHQKDKTPKQSPRQRQMPKQSPRQRQTKRSKGAGDD